MSFAEPMTPINVEKKVVANSPDRTRIPEMLVSWMTLRSAMNEALVVVAAMAKMTEVYETKVKARAHKVPLGIALLGCFKSGYEISY